MLNHAIDNFEMLSSIGQQLGIRGMIRALDCNDRGAELSVRFSQVCDELFLRLRRSDNENFPHALEHFRDIAEEFKIIGRSVASMRAFAKMGMFMLVLCFHH